MLVIVLILSAFLKLSVKCDIKDIIEPDILQEFSKSDFNITKMFSAMSPYHMQDNCKSVQAWVLTRHGTKWPAEDILSKIKDQLIPDIQQAVKEIYETPDNDGELRYDEMLQKNQKIIIRSIIKWENYLDQGSHKDLNDHGKQNMIDLGNRLKQKLWPLATVLNKDNVEVLSSNDWRCVLSGKKLIKAFFIGDPDDINIKSSGTDRRLELIKPSEDEVMVDNPDIHGEKINVETLFFKRNCSAITSRIQKMLFPDFIQNYEEYRKRLTDDMVFIIYYACTNSYYMQDDDGIRWSVWCLLFEYKDFKMFEDMHDLQYYYKNGYYLEKNTKMGNPLVNDLLHFIETPTEIKFKLFVGHTSNCLSFITRFGLFRDEKHLTVDNITDMTDRKWKTSSIAPIVCNVMAVIYDCGYTKLKVSIYVNEKPIKMVLSNGDKCVKCPIDDVIELIKSYKTEEILTPMTTEDQDEIKKKRKEKKAQQKREQQAADMRKKFIEDENRRQAKALNDDEVYMDTNEIHTK